MPVDPRIAMSFQMPQIAAPMELAQNAFALKGAMQQNALAEAKMAEFQQQQSDRNALRSLFAGGKMPEASEVYAIDPTLGASYEKGRYETGEAKTKADIAYWNQQRDTAARISDQPQWSAWRSSLPVPFQQFVPEQYSPENQRRTLATADDALGKIQFETTKTGIEGIDVSPSSPTFGTTLIRREAPPKTPAVQVNLPPGPKAEQSKKGELNVEIYREVRADANRSRKTLPAIDSAISILDKGFDTGFGTEAKFQAARVLSALGIPEADKFASDAAVFQSTVAQTVLDRQLEQKGPQTEADAARITQTSAQLKNPKDANRFILNVARAQAKRAISQQRFYDNWWNKNGTYEGVEDAWYSGEGGKSLFDDPLLSKSTLARSVVRTGTLGNRKVVEYSDGSVEYAD